MKKFTFELSKSLLNKSVCLVTLFALFFAGCDSLFINDGDNNSHITESEGYFYMMDRSDVTLHMLDTQLKSHKVWELEETIGTTSIQGITFDGEFLWVSAAGNADRIFQLDLTGDEIEIRNDFESPPGGIGTVRDIAWDGEYIWVLNNGSVALEIPPAIYKLNPVNGDIIQEYDLPTPEPRSLSYIPDNGDEYGRGVPEGYYYGDREKNIFISLRKDRRVFTEELLAPEPPEGQFRIFPSGLTYEILESGELKFWTVNSSFGNNYLFKINRLGDITDYFELPPHFQQAGPVVFTNVDIRLLPPPVLTGIFPNRIGQGSDIEITVTGENFRNGDGISLEMGEDISIIEIEFISSSELSVEISVSQDAQLGMRDITLELPDGQTATLENGLEVLDEEPELGFIWAVDFDSKALYKLSESGGILIQEWNTRAVAPGASPQGVTWDGESIWFSAAGTDRQIYRLDTSGSTLTADVTIPAPYPTGSGTVRDISWDFDSETIWAVNDGDDIIYQVDPADGNILSEIPAPEENTRSVAWIDGTLFSSENNTGRIWSWNSDTETWSEEFVSPLPEGASASNRRPQGLAWDGDNFWISNSRFDDDFILHVTPQGDLLQTFDTPNIGPDVIMGITFSRE